MKRLLFFLLFLPELMLAEVTLPKFFSDGMVLQQNAQVKIWGKADPGIPVKIAPSWYDRSIKVEPDQEGQWSVELQTRTADFNSYSLEISQKKSEVEIQDILFGEVWLCSGQSNMVMRMKGWYTNPIYGAPQAIADSHNDFLRIYDMERKCTFQEENDSQGKWEKACPESVYMTSATAYFFADQLYRTLQVPVAFILAPIQGASVISYMSKEAIARFPQYRIPQEGEDVIATLVPTMCYNGMIHPIQGYTVKGVLWYQGEADVDTPELYPALYGAMIEDWREKWGIKDLPFIFAQIAPYEYSDKKRPTNSAYLREAQSISQKEVADNYMVSLMDVGEERNIHPSEKKTVGYRLAIRALDKVYRIKGIYSDEPEYKSMEVKDGKVILTFDHAENGMTSYQQPVTGFAIAGADKVFYPAAARIRLNQVYLQSDRVPHPVAVRYAFTDYARGCLYTIEGCCASSFRTDDWKDEECRFEK